MIFENDLNVFHDDNSVFVDISKECVEYGRDSKVIQLISADDYLYVGLYKPFNQVYVEMKVANTNANTFTAQYYNGSTWNSLSNFYDLSKGFTRSGFLSWSKSTDWSEVAVNSEELFWIRLKPSADHSVTTELQGLNIVFADDQDLVNEFSSIASQLPNFGVNSYITFHQSVRDDIVQAIRNSGAFKYNNELKNITKWDFLSQDEIKRASIYHCLSKIFFELSDSIEDKWYQRSKDYNDKGNKALEVYYLSLDKNDDGVADSNEKLSDRNISLFRV